MDLYNIAGIDISLEPFTPAGGSRLGDAQHFLVCNCEWQAVVALASRAHGELGYSLEVTPLRCAGNRAKFDCDFPVIQPLFERVVQAPEARMTVVHGLDDSGDFREPVSRLVVTPR